MSDGWTDTDIIKLTFFGNVISHCIKYISSDCKIQEESVTDMLKSAAEGILTVVKGIHSTEAINDTYLKQQASILKIALGKININIDYLDALNCLSETYGHSDFDSLIKHQEHLIRLEEESDQKARAEFIKRGDE